MKEMTSRERVITTLDLKEPDRVPSNVWCTFEGYQNLRKGLGLEVADQYPTGSTTWTTDVAVEEDVVEILGADLIRINAGPPGGSPGFRPIEFSDVPFDMGIPVPEYGLVVDEWGVIRRKVAHEAGSYYEIIGYPLLEATTLPTAEGIKAIEDYPWPDPYDPTVVEDLYGAGVGLRERAKWLRANTPYAILLQGGRGGIFEQAKYMVGYAKIFSDFIEAPEFIAALFKKLMEIEIGFNRVALEACGEYVDLVRMSPEDLASEKSTFTSPAMFRKQILPFYTEACHATKEAFVAKNPNGKIDFHSCGAVSRPQMEGLVGEAGIQCYDSLQPKVREDANPAAQKVNFGDRLAFLGSIDVQEVLPWGSVDDVRAEVKQRIGELAPGGGYILTSSHRLEHDVPVANTKAMFEACREFGGYPIGP